MNHSHSIESKVELLYCTVHIIDITNTFHRYDIIFTSLSFDLLCVCTVMSLSRNQTLRPVMGVSVDEAIDRHLFNSFQIHS